jgi:predicted HicB family RNase H-like nuclease
MKSTDKKTKRVHVRMTPTIQRQLAAHAARQHMTISQLLREIVTSYCVRVYAR